MKSTGIIMSGDHPKKTLDGTKTMTRRVIKPQPFEVNQQSRLIRLREDDPYLRTFEYYCPYGQVGDRLWVRETWATSFAWEGVKPSDMPPSTRVYYFSKHSTEPPDIPLSRWRPSLFMPRWASRITLEITEVRVERVKDIGQTDISKEGIKLARMMPDEEWEVHILENKNRFAQLWDSLNAKRGYGWEVNPWVWVISFKVENS